MLTLRSPFRHIAADAKAFSVMAVSAFKSTTKRECAIGAAIESDNADSGVAPFQPSTPLNMKRAHRRTQSYSDFSAQQHPPGSSDANSRHLDSLFQQGKRASSRYQSDCESEVCYIFFSFLQFVNAFHIMMYHRLSILVMTPTNCNLSKLRNPFSPFQPPTCL